MNKLEDIKAKLDDFNDMAPEVNQPCNSLYTASPVCPGQWIKIPSPAACIHSFQTQNMVPGLQWQSCCSPFHA